VLPFASLSGDPEQDYFADGIVEDIITALSRAHWLLVIARNSSFTYQGSTPHLRARGALLSVPEGEGLDVAVGVRAGGGHPHGEAGWLAEEG
jgi:hypothetical protein